MLHELLLEARLSAPVRVEFGELKPTEQATAAQAPGQGRLENTQSQLPFATRIGHQLQGLLIRSVALADERPVANRGKADVLAGPRVLAGQVHFVVPVDVDDQVGPAANRAEVRQLRQLLRLLVATTRKSKHDGLATGQQLVRHEILAEILGGMDLEETGNRPTDDQDHEVVARLLRSSTPARDLGAAPLPVGAKTVEGLLAVEHVEPGVGVQDVAAWAAVALFTALATLAQLGRGRDVPDHAPHDPLHLALSRLRRVGAALNPRVESRRRLDDHERHDSSTHQE